MSRLTDLLRQARKTDPQLGADLEAEIVTLTKRRTFGLVFEQHQPEAVELPGRGVRRGDKVRVLPTRGETDKGDQRLWRVLRIERADGSRIARLEELKSEEPDNQVVLANDTVVVAEFRDTIYPGLVETSRVERGGDKPFHAVINAENYHALEMLTYTHPESVDLIYIDPPYNTGNDDWIYNDRHVSQDDDYRHSKWLAFMERRLKIARDLIRDTGVIIVAIGDDEHHRLRMLLDQTFDPDNFLANLVWQGGTSALAKHTGGGVDYMLVYAKNRDAHVESIGQWRTPKQGTEEVLAAGIACWEESKGDADKATVLFRAWWRPNRKRFETGVSAYDRIDESGRIFFAGDLANGMWRPNLQYDVLHPATKKPVRMPANGWRHEPAKMQRNIEAGLVLFGSTESTIPTMKRYLDEYLTQVPVPTFYKDRRAATLHLSKVLGERSFPNPKDVSILMQWLRSMACEDAVILDFFGGSGSTMEAVMRLNAEDDGTRQCILVTNNEVGVKEDTSLRKAGHRKGDPEWEARGVYEYVTKPRIATVVTGQRPDGSTYDNTVDANVEFFTLTYESPLAVQHSRAFERIAPILWLRAGSQGRIITNLGENGWDVADTYGVLENLDQADAFLQAVAVQASLRQAFIVTDDDSAFQMVCRDLPAGVLPVRLYESYLQNFEINTGRNL